MRLKDYLMYIKYLKFANSFRVDSKKGHLLFRDKRVAMIPAGMFSELYLGLSDVTGKGGAASTLYMGAKKSASVLYSIVSNTYGEDNLKSEEKFGKLINEIISLAGYGNCEVVKVDFKNIEVIIRMRDLLTSSGIVKSDVPVCHAERGAMTGIIENITKKPCNGQEVKCQAMGDEYCEFVIKEG
ncbi:MAG: V4R domain-containing protein [Halobacteriota archaeon]|nr:V4R domain-containing protein [Halobacteriota archaeon]